MMHKDAICSGSFHSSRSHYCNAIMLFVFSPSRYTTVATAASVIYQTMIPPVVSAGGGLEAIEVEVDLQGDQQQHHIPLAKDHQESSSSKTTADEQCGIWLAPSTIKGAGLGMFAGVDFDVGQEFLRGGDSVIAITDISEHNTNSLFKDDAFLWDEYTWNAVALKMDSEGYKGSNVASEGFGAAANCFLPIYNVDEWYPVLTNTGLHRSKDAGAGASTLFHQRKSTAKTPIAAGSELFVSYGTEWFLTRTQLGPIPLDDDLDAATALLKKFSALQGALRAQQLSSTRDNATITGDDIATAIWATFVKDTRFTDSRVLQGAFRHDDPSDLHSLQTVFHNDVAAARIANSRRSLEWLRDRGTCGDHMVAKPSTIPQAGMGAFATRNLPAGTVVAQLPMIHITERSRLDMFALVKVDEDGNRVPAENDTVPIGRQLLLNYCYGHGESSLLLCPYGPMVNYVNHNNANANVRLQWGRAATGNHMPALLNSTLNEIETSDATAKLAMEFVALRDILADEEIFLDYGDEWDAAWKAHVANWKAVPGADGYISAAQLQADKTSRLRTVFEEIDVQTYPDGVELKCDTAFHLEPSECREQYLNGTLETYLWQNDAAWWPCGILRYRMDDVNGDYLYTVHLYEKDKNNAGKISSSILIKDVPRAGFHFVDKPYTSDTFLPNAFRHDIRIPDAIFPEAWRNSLK